MCFYSRQSGETPTFCLLGRYGRKYGQFSSAIIRIMPFYRMMLAVIILFWGCNSKPAPQDNKSQPAEIEQITKELAQIDTAQKDPFEKIAKLETYYEGLSRQMQLHFSHDIFRSLFNVAYAHPDSTVLPFYKQQFERHADEPKIQVESLLSQAAYYLYINQQVDSGKLALDALTPFLPTFNDTINKSYYTLLAQVFYQKGDFQKAADYYLKTIKIAEKLKDSMAIIGNYGNLSAIYSSMDEEQKAVPLKKLSLDYYIRQKNDAYAFIGEVSLARSYANLSKMDSAFYHYENALKLKEKGISNPSVEIILYTNLGEIYFERGNLKKALYFFDLCKAPLAAIGTEEQRLMYIIYATPAYNEVKADISPEISEVKKAITLFSQQSNLILVKAAYFNLYMVAEKRGWLQDALQYYKSYDSVSNILASQDNNKYITQLRTQYELQKKQTIILSQQKQIVKKTAYNRLLGALLIAGVAFSGFIITYGRLRRKKKEADLQRQFSTGLIARSETERSRLARDLHDGLGQNILLLKHQVKDGEKIDVNSIDRLLDEVRVISRNVHPIMLDQIGFKESVNHICRQLSEKESLFISTDLEYNGELGKEKELQLFRIFQEGLNNVIKYAQAQAANIQTRVEGSDLIAVIRDNGKGFDVSSTLNSGASFGLFSILERSRAINGKATIHSGATGTFIKIKVPIDV
ncbi:Histidine kinase [Arachidicoccus rhizosphaerae]|uniref:histidine kinase n=1 Tax=Arachidicoccus rhizosphaerae TaxID=551991 RepID=A0A1H3Z6M3_9BACT|nr:ATP-binding protein [Arachidicoccus rhizosphaerae]SEA19473.1 Histidine kinase [Arachidicoccus rhizosphaerae]